MSLLHKKEQQNKNNDPLIRLMTPMIAGILVCVFCLVSMTWAWFTASVNTPPQTMQSANRSTSVKVYEISQSEDENRNVTKTLIMPQISEEISLAEDTQETADEGTIIAGETAVWELAPEKTYEVVMTGSGTASTGYCKIALSHTTSGKNTPETKLYQTSNFEKEHTVRFTYNTGGFSDAEGVTATQYMEYVEKTAAPTLAIASFWGSPAEESEPQVALMSLRGTAEEIILLADGDVIGLAPIPCPEAKAETEVELEGFEVQESAEISAEEDYKVSLTLKEGYEMPSEVVVNIGGKDYVVSTEGAEASDDAPYYDAQSGILTVPSALLSDGIKVSVKATATPIPEEEPEEEETTEETTEEESEETTDDNETEEDNSADTPSDNNVAIDNPNKKEENGEEDSDEPVKTPTGDGGNDDDDDEADNNSGSSSSGNASSSGNNREETEDEKADVKLNLSQLTINLEETQIPTNADLVLTLSAKEDMELPEQIVITLDKTIRDENIEDEETTEDKTEYIINTDGKDNPDGFEFDAESGELTISSELLENVREITIADTEENEADEDDEKATLTFEVKNLTFDFTDDEIVTDEDVVITFTAGEGYELPETIIITIDGVEYIIYTSEEDSDKNPEGITFDIETGTLTISKDLLKDADAITIAAEGIEKEDEESKDEEENSDADEKDESEDKDDTDNENDTEGGETTDKEPEGGTDTPNTEDKTETEGGTDAPGEENTETTTPETNPDNTTEGEDDDNSGEDNGETEPSEPNTEVTTPTIPDTEDNTNTEQDGENVETEENGEGSTESGTEETTPDTESGGDDETTTPTEPTTPAEPSEPAVSPETPNTSESTSGGNDGDGETGNADNASSESSSNSGNDSSKSDTSSESSTSTTPSVTPTAPTTSAPAASETTTPSASTQASGNSSSTPDSSAPAQSTNSNSNGASQASGTTTPSGSKETSSEE